jgi:phosphoribosylcarboxyaminoimidazole (NCAIR) mutase
MKKPIVGILMGSDSDLAVMDKECRIPCLFNSFDKIS